MVKTLKKRTNAESQDSLLSCFVREIYGDSRQTITLCSSMEYIQSPSKIAETKSSPIDIGKSIKVETGKGSQFVLLHGEIQQLFKHTIENYYGKYNCSYSPLVSESDVIKLQHRSNKSVCIRL